MRQLSTLDRARILHCLVEGMGMRATSRLCDVSINTVTKLLEDAGNACAEYQDRVLRHLKCQRVQVDEIWCFCYAKPKHLPPELRGQPGYGDVWTWIATDADTRLVPCWHVGTREAASGINFIEDLHSRMAGRIQLTSDGHNMYLKAIENAFGTEVDYAMLVKQYGKTPEGPQQRYSPPACIGAVKTPISGQPALEHVSTSYVERINLGLRMQCRRFTRLTNAHSKKIANHKHAVALHFMAYNFVKIHASLRVTPAMEAGITDRLWSMEDVVGLIGQSARKAA